MEPDDPADELSPMDEIEMADLQVELAGLDEEQTMFDPDAPPKAPSPKEEGTTSLEGKKEVDLMDDTPPIDDLTISQEIDISLD